MRLPLWFVRLQVWKVSAYALAYCSLSCMESRAFTQILIDPKSPAGIEEEFIAATTNQYNAKLVKNPLAAHTYTLTILGPNPAWNVPPSYADIVKFSYPYGFVAGQEYERQNDLNIITDAGVDCSADVVCSDTISGAANDIYIQNLSTPTVVPGF